MSTRICKYCEGEYTPGPRHPGLITVCGLTECQERAAADGVREPSMKTACVSWEGKHTPIITVVDCPQISAQFNGIQRRHGASIGLSFTGGVRAASKCEAGAEKAEKNSEKNPTYNQDPAYGLGANYYSKLGESHSRKR
jgi:hypothetical protein